MGACRALRGQESPGEQGQGAAWDHGELTLHRASEDKPVADSGVPRFLENCPRMCWREQALGLLP